MYYNQKAETSTDPKRWVDWDGTGYTVGFVYDPNLVADIKTIPAQLRVWSSKDKIWKVHVAATDDLLKFVKRNDFFMSETAHTAQASYRAKSIEERKQSYNLPKTDEATQRLIDVDGAGQFIISLLRDDKNHQAVVRAIPGRYFDPSISRWVVPSTQANAVAMFALRYQIDVTDAAKIALGPLMSLELSSKNDLKMELYPFQKAGVKFMCEKRFVLNGDEMGCGKTAQSIATATELDAFPVLVICPKSLIYNWRSEWKQWTDKIVHIVGTNTFGSSIYQAQRKRVGGTAAVSPLAAHVYITNYEGTKKLKGLEHYFKMVVIDEAHNLKNNKTQRFKMIEPFCLGSSVQSVIALTGTPVLNRVQELKSIIRLLRAWKHFGGERQFENQYVATSRSKDYPQRLKMLNQIMSANFFIRREKQDVMTEMPDKIRQKVYVPLDNVASYLTASADLRKYLMNEKHKTGEQADKAVRFEALTKVMYLKRAAAEGKIESGCQMVDGLIEQGEKVVCFAHHKEVIDKLRDRVGHHGAYVIDGDTPTELRQKYAEAFQTNPKVQVLVLGLKAASVGLNLQAASRVVFFEQGWTPGEMEQAEDRCYRIGTTQTVYCYYLIAEIPPQHGQDVKSVDERVYELIEKKRSIARAVTNTQMIVAEKEMGMNDVLKEILGQYETI